MDTHTRSVIMAGFGVGNSAPDGCSISNHAATCDYDQWRPPLYDVEFSQIPGYLLLENVNGVIPTNAFGGLSGASSYSGTQQLNIECGFGTTNELTLLSNSFTSNLSWVEEVSITDCTNMQIADMAFSSLTGITVLSLMSGNLMSISSTAMYGLTQLTTLYIYASFPTSGIPSGLFAGLTGLTELDMSRTTLNSIPAGLFDDLKNLQSLYLSECGLTTLPNNVFLPLLSLTTLDVSTNNFHCDCNLQWLGQYLQDTGFTSTTCTTPSNLNTYDLTRSLASLSCTESGNSDFDWQTVAIAGTAGLGLLLAAAALVAFFHQRRRISRLLRMNKSKQTNIRNISGNQREPSTNSNNKNWTDHDTNRSTGKVTPYDGGTLSVRPTYLNRATIYDI